MSYEGQSFPKNKKHNSPQLEMSPLYVFKVLALASAQTGWKKTITCLFFKQYWIEKMILDGENDYVRTKIIYVENGNDHNF